uniref:HNH domain-containing protein n=1 Tax=Magnetococcus massalia (strain MO-1) TaxID=451514 RepID=A0A1S7LMW8_MAGMO|nr:Conserved protein of unknown function [Candidatus Magnetococcus massalia]
MRPIKRGDIPKESDGSDIYFNEYQQARDYLEQRMGHYCSYCETPQYSGADVEHVQPKSIEPDLALTWENFLLACTNCNSTKGSQPIDLQAYYWPDSDNTMLAFEYFPEGRIKAAKRLNAAQIEIANRTLQLTGLDRVPGHSKLSPKDKRYKNRKEVWGIAHEAKKDLSTSDIPILRKQIIQLALASGFFSIWMTVFADNPEMRNALIDAFPGTRGSGCFDDNGAVIPRPGGDL